MSQTCLDYIAGRIAFMRKLAQIQGTPNWKQVKIGDIPLKNVKIC